MALGDVGEFAPVTAASVNGGMDKAGSGASPPARSRLVLRAIVVCAAVALMVLGPLQAVGGESPQRFGWHMYTRYVSMPEAEVTTADGAKEQVPLEQVVSGGRIEIDYFAPTAEFLCRTRDDVVSVRLWNETPAREEVFACSGF